MLRKVYNVLTGFRFNSAFIRILYFGISILLLILSIRTFVLINRTSKLNSSIQEHVDRKVLLLQSFSSFQDIESATRGYLVLNNDFFLTTRVEGLRKLKVTNSELKYKLSDNELQWKRFTELEKIYETRFDQLNKAVQSNNKRMRMGVVESSGTAINTVRTLINSMLDWEDVRINDHNRILKENIEKTPRTMLVLTVLFILFSLGLYLYLSKQLRKSKLLQDDLKGSYLKNVQTVNQLQKTNDQMRNFTFVASHDLQEPLRKIRTFSSRVLSQKLTPKTAREDIEKIREAAARMSELLESIVRFTSLEMSELHIALVDLNKIIDQTLIDLQIQIIEKDADIHLNPLPTIYCDPIQIRQLFFHLISNSLKFSEGKPVIEVDSVLVNNLPEEVKLDNQYSYYKISFIDNGIGFNKDHTQKMFMLFHKFHHYQKYSGTGIGLAMCMKIAENHKGTIVAHSKENSGSVFDVYLPHLEAKVKT